MRRRFCAYCLEAKYSDGFTKDFCTLIPSLKMEEKTSFHSSTGKTPAMLEKGGNSRVPEDTMREDLIEIHSKASRFKIMPDNVKHHAKKACMMLSNVQQSSGTRVIKYHTSK
ncbi:hypothetical protein O181_038133 [Austropuccinia psidii MF-1]|uniref:Uncharacterized protein n=1 Tax=Austropuccinia psidii MF-1 TaxID=1389203 RepID=A0A9Q3DCR8_9BASI|nr:hypothetical protein [Austropuccinia psidii MF-1]